MSAENREYLEIRETEVDYNLSCLRDGEYTDVVWFIHPNLLNVLANGQTRNQIVFSCGAKNAPKQADGKTPRICAKANDGVRIEEL